MSSARVESPLLQELRRQPSPPCVSRMPKPSACRKLFAVDNDATDRFLKDELAKIEEEQRKDYGFDFDRGEPLPDPDGSSRYTDWEAVPKERVSSFYHEIVARRKPCHPSSRPTPAFSTSSSNHQSSTNGHMINPAPPCSTGRNTAPVVPTRLGTRSSRSCSSARRPDLQPAHQSSTSTSTTSTLLHRPKEIPPISEDVSGSALACQPCPASESRPKDFESSEESIANNTRTSATQCKITDYMRQRKRTGSESSSSSSSVASTDADGNKRPRVPAKRRRQRPASSILSFPTTGRS